MLQRVCSHILLIIYRFSYRYSLMTILIVHHSTIAYIIIASYFSIVIVLVFHRLSQACFWMFYRRLRKKLSYIASFRKISQKPLLHWLISKFWDTLILIYRAFNVHFLNHLWEISLVHMYCTWTSRIEITSAEQGTRTIITGHCYENH